MCCIGCDMKESVTVPMGESSVSRGMGFESSNDTVLSNEMSSSVYDERSVIHKSSEGTAIGLSSSSIVTSSNVQKTISSNDLNSSSIILSSSYLSEGASSSTELFSSMNDHYSSNNSIASSSIALSSLSSLEEDSTVYGAITLMNWNIHYQNSNTKGVARIIDEVNPDIVGLCEFTASPDALISDLSEVSDRNYTLQPGRPWFKGYGTAIIYDDNTWEALEGGVESIFCEGTLGGNRAAN